jgi:hypothetical protein
MASSIPVAWRLSFYQQSYGRRGSKNESSASREDRGFDHLLPPQFLVACSGEAYGRSTARYAIDCAID